MTEYKFEDLRKQTVAQLRKIAEGVEHEALQDPAKMPKGELLAALCQALGIEAGESPEETVQDKEPATQESEAAKPPEESAKEEPAATQEDAATEPPEESAKEEPAATQEDAAAKPPEESAKEEPAAVQEDAATEPPEESKKEEPEAVQEDAVTEPPEESKKEEPAAAQEDAATEPAPEGAKAEEPPTKKSAEKKKAPAQESTPTESPAVVSKEKGKLKLQIRELKSQRVSALDAHDHVLLKSIRRRIRTLKRKVRRLAA